jgi:hypothetical protein
MMRSNAPLVCCFAAFLAAISARSAPAQQEVYHPGETYDSLQAGRDAFLDAEAQRRALIGRQIMVEDQIMQQNTWADPQNKYQPVRPESYGPILPKSPASRTLADVYAYPTDGGPVYYGGTPAPIPTSGYAAGAPVFQPWPRVSNDIWGAPYYGYVRQPIGHVKIWTSRLGYIYKPIYASPPMESPQPAPRAVAPVPQRPVLAPDLRAAGTPSPTGALAAPPPPPRPAFPLPAHADARPEERPDPNPPKPNPPLTGQEI